MAWYRAYKKDQSANDRRLYEAAEDAAKAGKVGLWADDGLRPTRVTRNMLVMLQVLR